MRLSRSWPLVVPLVLLVAVPTASAAVSWLTPSGSNVNFDYANGNTDNQLFVPVGTNPTITASSLLLFPSNFRADAAGGAAEVTSDTIRFSIHAKPGKELSSFIVNEYGDYSILGSGTNTAVKAFGTLFLTNLDTGATLSDTMDTNPIPLGGTTGVTSGAGLWQGNETIVAIPSGWVNVQVVLNNILHAGSDIGTSSVIEKKIVHGGIEIILVIPEPGTLSLCLLGAALLLSRRGVGRQAEMAL